MLLTLRGSAILYQGDELALEDGVVPADAHHRRCRPAARSRANADAVDADGSRVAVTRGCRSPIRVATSRSSAPIRRARSTTFAGSSSSARRFGNAPYRTLPSAAGVWAYARGDATCVVNLTEDVVGHEGLVLEPWQGVIL